MENTLLTWPKPPSACPASFLNYPPPGTIVCVAGLVILRQRPGTAKGVIFLTLEDETGYTNVVIWRRIASEQRQILLNAQLLGIKGHIERDGQVIHLIAKQLVDFSPLLGKLVTKSRNFH